MKKVVLCAFLIALASADLFADEASTNRWPKVVKQTDVGETTCVPCAIFDAFCFGDAKLANLATNLPGKSPAEKVQNLINLYGKKPSGYFHHRLRYSTDIGVGDADIAPFANDWMKQDVSETPVRGEYLTLHTNEIAQQHLDRVYRLLQHSLNAGFPPVLTLQSYVAKKSIIHYCWYCQYRHSVTVVGIQALPPDGTPGFSMQVADSLSGRVLETYVYAEENHPFNAKIGYRLKSDDEEIPTWGDVNSQDYPYLLILSPELEGELQGQVQWHERTICTLEHAVYR